MWRQHHRHMVTLMRVSHRETDHYGFYHRIVIDPLHAEIGCVVYNQLELGVAVGLFDFYRLRDAALVISFDIENEQPIGFFAEPEQLAADAGRMIAAD